ncbi:MAG: calcineurin-like phosphoesterase family protein [Myxococcaceae bacterium]|nr:calcineurin-like phosphoesterase family protein [Myxococcaceae bacterium]
MLQYFTLASALTLLSHLYFGARLFADAPWRRRFRLLLVAHWIALPAAMVFSLRAPASTRAWSVPLAHLTFFDVGLCLLLLAALALRDAALALAWLVARPRPDPSPRRRWIRRALDLAVLSTAGGMSLAGYGLALAQPFVRRVRVTVGAGRLRAGTRPLRVVQVSDLHVGPTIRRAYVDALVDTVNALDGDLVVLTGDLVDGFVAQLRDEVAPLGRLRARRGVYFVTGNHEYFYRADEWLAALRALGIAALANRHVSFEHEGATVLLAGLDDPNAGPSDRHAALAASMTDAPAGALRILLAHRPADAVEASRRGFDVQLSGHLHGGQFIPLTWLLRLTEPFVAGLYRHRGLWLYVNRGAGYWGPPNRLGARQEITVLEIAA